MAAPPATDNAITASLFFAVGQDRPASPGESVLPEELRQIVMEMLHDQGASDAVAHALNAVRAGREAVARDTSLTISAQRYDQLRRQFLSAHGIDSGKGRNLWPVGSTTILKRAGGSWSRALEAAGLASSTRERSSGFGRARFSTQQIQAAVRDFIQDATRDDVTPSYQHYTVWRKQGLQRGRTDLPSGPTIRNTCGSWSAAVKQAADQPREVSRAEPREEPPKR